MPELIEKGYLYIAQPPLYRAAKGKTEHYLKDDAAREDYLINLGLDGAVLTLGSGAQVAGADLRRVVDMAAQAKHLMEPLIRKVGSVNVVQQTAILGGLSPQAAANPELAAAIAAKLDTLSPATERGWSGLSDSEGGLAFKRRLRGVTSGHIIDAGLIRSAEAHRLDQMKADLAESFSGATTLTVKDRTIDVHGPIDLVDTVIETGSKGIDIQRYKGLGEMNPEQLWATTLDPAVRSLLQVKVNHVDEAEEIFSTLMGDLVEPRREFIQQNALNVANLDV
jgi:DNA gyrase subunit B